MSDDSSFDPRLRWARENQETHLYLDKKIFDEDMKILKFMEKKPFTVHDIVGHFQIPQHRAYHHIRSLQSRGVMFSRERVKELGVLYSVKSRPMRMFVKTPKTTERYH